MSDGVSIDSPDSGDGSVTTECRTYCDRCGDCLACYGQDACYDGGGHVWPAVESDPKDQR